MFNDYIVLAVQVGAKIEFSPYWFIVAGLAFVLGKFLLARLKRSNG